MSAQHGLHLASMSTGSLPQTLPIENLQTHYSPLTGDKSEEVMSEAWREANTEERIRLSLKALTGKKSPHT